MKKRRLFALVLMLALLLCGCGQSKTNVALAALDACYDQTPVAPNEYLRALAWAKSGAGYDGWQQDCYAAAEELLRACDGVLSNTKSTEYSAVILALTAAGYDTRDVAGYDLTEALCDTAFVTRQGINGAIFALLALDSGDYPAPDGLRYELLDAVLSRQLSDGGFAFSGDRADPDMTAMALAALANYRDRAEVVAAVETGLDALSALQNENSGFSSYGEENVESCAQVILALAALDVSVSDERFVKNGVSVLDALLSYQLEDGRFSHLPGGEANEIATMQAYAALTVAAFDGSLYVPGNGI